MDDLFKCDSLGDIKSWLSQQTDNGVGLLAAFERLKNYQNAVEWNQLVLICEAITLLDIWDKLDLEPQEAYCGKGMSGSWETSLMNANWQKLAGSWRDWSKSGDSFVIYKGADSKNYGVAILNSQRNMLPTTPFKIGRYVMNCQKSVKSIVAEINSLNDHFEAQMQPKLYGDGFYYAQIYTQFSAHDFPSDPSVQSQYFHDEQDVPANEDNYYIEPKLKMNKLSTRRGRLCWSVDRYYNKKWGELPLSQQKQSVGDDLKIIFAELEARLTKKKTNFNIKLSIEHANAILNQWLNKKADEKYYQEIENEFTQAEKEM